ncbi:MAG: methyltransferase domain-containing protein [Rhodothalassiaceae bacterium]
MRADVSSLQRFYASPLGRSCADLVATRLNGLWRTLPPQAHIAGIGYAPPYLERLSMPAASRVAFMPGPQGVRLWPEAARNAAALIEESDWPLPNGAYDGLILAHALEVADDLAGLLRETWRCLNPGGRAVIIVPRRRGFWSSADSTPFGFGRPFSQEQLRRLLGEHLLPVTRLVAACVWPPLTRFGLWRLAPTVERLAVDGGATRLGGILIVECEKQLEGGIKVRPKRLPQRQLRPVPAPVTGLQAPERREQRLAEAAAAVQLSS